LTVQTFATARHAKEFLVSRIIAESQREGVPLSEVEGKMLYFSESGWTLPDIAEVNDAFDRDYDQAKYEEKIGTLIHTFCAEARKNNRDEFDAWQEAVRTIRGEDHYLLVLIAAAEQSPRPSMSWARFLKLSAIAFATACVILAIGYLFIKR
jgi:hypothetical protein